MSRKINFKKDKKFLSRKTIVLIIIAILFLAGLVTAAKIMDHKKTQAPKPECNTSVTQSCEGGTTITTQDCINGKLINTGKICPCLRDSVITCEDNSIVVTQQCIDGNLINTGKICPCFRDSMITCEDGSKVITQNCVNGVLINTGKICPCFRNITQTCYDNTLVTTQNCVNGVLINTGNSCPSPPVIAPLMTAERLQAVFNKCPEIAKLPNDAKMVIEFDDANKQYLGYAYFVQGKGHVQPFSNQAYDFWLALNINKFSTLETSSNVCSDLKGLISSGDAFVITSPANPLTLVKYMGFKPCVM
jgi:hypothetical protein